MTGDVESVALREYVARHRDASVPEALGRFPLDPVACADVVGALLDDEDVGLSADAGEGSEDDDVKLVRQQYRVTAAELASLRPWTATRRR